MKRQVGVRLAVLVIGLWASHAAGVAAAADADLTGNWTIVIGTPPPDGRLATLRLKQEGDKFTGKVVLPGGKSLEIEDGKVAKNRVSFVQVFPGGAKLYFVGDATGNTIKGQTEIEPLGKPKRAHFDWEARRIAD